MQYIVSSKNYRQFIAEERIIVVSCEMPNGLQQLYTVVVLNCCDIPAVSCIPVASVCMSSIHVLHLSNVVHSHTHTHTHTHTQSTLPWQPLFEPHFSRFKNITTVKAPLTVPLYLHRFCQGFASVKMAQ